MTEEPRRLADCRLYTFVDTAYLRGRPPVEIARQLCDGGADLVQLRAKALPVDDVKRIAESLVPITQAAGVHLVINDHLEVARAVGASICHLGQEDFFDAGFERVADLPGTPPAGGSPASGPGVQIGLSSHAPAQAERAVAAGAAYVAIGPVFTTPTKPGRPPVTLEYVRWAAANVRLPWFAIGGIHLGNLDDVLAAGATRICVVSAILNAPDIAGACRAFRHRLGCA